MILKAKHNAFIYPFFQKYTLWKISRSFEKAQIIGNFKDMNKPVLVIANHVSWWDGFWLMYLNLKLLNRKFHFMMLESQLRKHWFFNHSGGYSVNKSSRSMVESLAYTRELLQDSKNMVFMFPQGAIMSMHQKEFIFEKGIERILLNNSDKIQVLFVANLIDYFSMPKPELCIYISEYQYNSHQKNDIEKAYQDFYNQAIEQQLGRAI